MSSPGPQVEHLDDADCRRLLRGGDLGRLALVAGDRVDVFPLNYLVFDEDV